MKRRASLISLVLLTLPVVTVACGYPISASEITATAEREREIVAVQVELVTQASSRGVTPLADEAVSPSPAVTSTPSPTSVPSATPTTATHALTTATSPTPPVSTPTPSGIESATAIATTPALTATASVTLTPLPSATPSSTATPSSPTPAQASFALSGPAAEVLAILNRERAKLGLRTLVPNQYLTAAATNYASYMAQANFFGHDGPDNKSKPQSRVIAAGYQGSWRGETLAAGQMSAAEAMDVWLVKSPPHRAILLDPSAVEVGIAYYFEAGDYYRHYWVLETGIP